MSAQHLGSCLCGTVKYELLGEFQSFFLCHCSRCQKDTGSSNAANLFAQDSSLNWLQGENNVKTYQYPNSLHTKSFCKNCGSALPTYSESINSVVVPAGSLDTQVPIPPSAKIFVAHCATWLKNVENAPDFDELPE